MEWYYGDNNGQQVGPLSPAQLEDLIQKGIITGATLVWRAGMEQWQPLQTAQPALLGTVNPRPTTPAATATGAVEATATANTAVCAECQRVFPQNDMVVLNRRWVCASCKPIFVQRLKEGVGPMGGQLWRYKRQMVLRLDTPLPDRCIKCNAPAQGSRLRRKLSWHPPAIYLLLLINLLVYAIVALIVRKRASLDIGLCEAHRKRRVVVIVASWIAIVTGVGLIGYGVARDLNGMLGFGIILLLTAIVAGLILARTVVAAKIDKEFIWLAGVCREYLSDLPEWHGPS